MTNTFSTFHASILKHIYMAIVTVLLMALMVTAIFSIRELDHRELEQEINDYHMISISHLQSIKREITTSQLQFNRIQKRISAGL